MGEFKNFNQLLQDNLTKMATGAKRLYEVEVDKEEMWELYLDSFPAGTNKIFRERREYDCTCCKHFIRAVGNVVAIENGKVTSIWDFDTHSEKYQPVVDALAAYVKSHKITNVFLTDVSHVGTAMNIENLLDGSHIEWEHFSVDIPDIAVYRGRDTLDSVKGELKASYSVYKRSLSEISQDAIELVLDLINDNTINRGMEWKATIEAFLADKLQYEALTTDEQKELFAWEKSVTAGGALTRIRNHSIGTLLVNLTEGMSLRTAIEKYESIVDPANYQRTMAKFSAKMAEEGKKALIELGYKDSLGRRFATVHDITVENLLYSNKDVMKQLEGIDAMFEELGKAITVSPKKFENVEEMPIEKFIETILPTATSLEVLLENKHERNLVSLIAPQIRDSKSMFKWNNNFSWAYKGNLAGSSLKQNVAKAGGNVDGVLRFSIQWNDKPGIYNNDDLDAHCIEPDGNHIYWNSPCNQYTGGNLDIDVREPNRDEPAVENITWPDMSRMKKGKYAFFVKNYNHRQGSGGFRAEIEFQGQVYNFDFPDMLRDKQEIMVAEVYFDGTNFTIKEALPSVSNSVNAKEVWGLTTNQFVPVAAMMLSPNYWDAQAGVGNKHYFFMLKGCVNPEEPNGFYNEFLTQDLRKHRQVLEALGSTAHVAHVENQLSGVGFSSTQRGDIVVRVNSPTERILRLTF